MAENNHQQSQVEIAQILLKREKLQVYCLLLISLALSIVIKLGIEFQLFPLEAISHFEFYRSVFSGFLLLAGLPYLIAYFSGRLLRLISFVLRSNQDYPTQYFIAWVLLATFTVYLITSSLDSRENYARMLIGCKQTLEKKLKDKNKSPEVLEKICAHKVMTIYSKVRHCRVSKISQKRSECTLRVLNENGFF